MSGIERGQKLIGVGCMMCNELCMRKDINWTMCGVWCNVNSVWCVTKAEWWDLCGRMWKVNGGWWVAWIIECMVKMRRVYERWMVTGEWCMEKCTGWWRMVRCVRCMIYGELCKVCYEQWNIWSMVYCKLSEVNVWYIMYVVVCG